MTETKERKAKIDPPIRNPLVRSDDEKSQAIRHISDGFFEINKGLAIVSDDPYYEVDPVECDQWAVAFYNSMEQWGMLDKVTGNVGPAMLIVITLRIVLRDIFHYIKERENKAMDEEMGEYDEAPPIQRVGTM